MHCYGLAESDESSSVTVSLRRVTVSLGAMQTITEAEKDPNVVEDTFIHELLGRGPGLVIESELEWEKAIQR